MQWSVLIFAAGHGTRMGDLVKDRPKPLVHVAGKPLIDHALALTNIPQIRKRVVNLHYKADMIRDHLKETNVVFSDETAGLLETGGGLRHALPLLGNGPVITTNSDAVWHGPNPITLALEAWRDDMECLLVMIPPERVRGHLGKGDFTAAGEGRIKRGPGDIYTGVQIIRSETLHSIDRTAFSMNVVWDQMIARGGLYGTTYPGHWCDVGQPSSIPLAEAMTNV